MLKLIQIIKYLKSQKYTDAEIHNHIVEIVDNSQSDIFDLSERDVVSISDVFYDDSRYESAFKVGTML